MRKQNKIVKKGYRLLFCACCILQLTALGQPPKPYPAVISAVLTEAKTNRPELEKALNYFYATGDSLKIKSIDFLLSNISLHSSSSYYWADSTNRNVNYNEENYSSAKEATEAFETIKAKHGKLHPVSYTYKDIDSIKGDMLIENVNLAVEKIRKRGVEMNKSNEELFLEYTLPYRTSIEPLQNWRKTYITRFDSLLTESKLSDNQLSRLYENIKIWFTNTYGVEIRKEPLPRLGALQLLTKAKGPCEDIAGLTALIARSKGFPSAVDFIPAWATSSGLHFLNFLSPLPGNKNHFDAAEGVIIDTLAREPAKVIRTTYSAQKKTIAFLLRDTSLIPDGYMRFQNYKDVTEEYWRTADIHTKLFKLRAEKSKAAYICVWNYANWRPVWYGIKKDNDSVVYTNMAKGAVYLPMYYIDKRMIPAGWPVLNDYGRTIVLQPDTLRKRTILIEEQTRYLAFRAGKKYSLYYWNNTWIPLGTKIPEATFSKLQFDNVPSNALLLLIPEYSQGKERPFLIKSNGERLWF